jgi:tripartite-type tricarboxylate transporter receptor subunit TctC
MKTLLKTVVVGICVVLMLSLGLVMIPQEAAAAGWTPKKPVEFVIMAGKGGGADKMARLMQTVIAKHKFSKKPFTPINKPGGTGAEALVYLKQKKGDNHVIMVTLNSFYTTPLRQPGLKVDPSGTFTPIARMAEDTFLLWVNSKTPIMNVDDFVKAAKAKGNEWLMAGTGKASEDNLLTDYLNTTYGLNMKYIPYKGGGKVASTLAGQNCDSTVNNPSEQIGFFQAGNTRPLAAFTPERLPLFPDVPTFKEIGKDFVYFMQRSVVGAPGMSKEATKYYQELFKTVYNSKEWQDYMRTKSLQGEFMTGDALKAYWKTNNEIHRTMLKKMGAIK